MKRLLLGTLAGFLLTSQLVTAQQLLVTESSNDQVMLFDALDGTLINSSFIDLTLVGAGTPIECHEGPSALYIADQTADSVYMFSLDGATHLGTITGGMDNIRGLCFANGVLYVSNSGTGNGAPGDAILMFDAVGTPLGSFPASDPFDVVEYGGNLLVTDIANEDLLLFDYAGNSLGIFHDSDGLNGIDFPEQANPRGSTGGVLVGGFSSPIGVYDYDSTGTEAGYWAVGTGVRGVYELGHGDFLFTDTSGVHILDPASGTSTTVLSGVSARFIQPYGAGVGHGTLYCFGDPGVDTPCPCGNDNDGSVPESGCANGVFASGARLLSNGTPSLTGDQLVLSTTGLEPNQAGLYFQANNDLSPGLVWGDGLRCAGGQLKRLGVVVSDATGYSDTSGYPLPISHLAGNVLAGDTKYYQCWYSNPSGSPCATGFNSSNGYAVTWEP